MKNTLIIVLLVISTTLPAQIERPKWELGGGVRLNYMLLDGGFSGTRSSDGYGFEVNYQDIGMANYSPSFAIALGGRYKKWNLSFASSRGKYDGSFTTTTDIVKDDIQIDAGSEVNGAIDMTMFALDTHFGLIQRKHDLGIGIGIMVLNMGSNYVTTDTYGNEIPLGGDYWFAMPFLSVSGRLNFGNFRLAASGGGAIYKGEKDGSDFDVMYYTFDISAAYEFLHTSRLTFTADVGYRNLFMDMDIENDMGLYHEKDIFKGPYATIRILFSSKEMWQYIKRKDRDKESNN
jgi:hypothetical protein